MSSEYGAQGDKVVFTNGCFDLLHPGHIALLRFCRSLGRVVVGLNSDSSVRLLKGPDRPIWKQEKRKFELEQLDAVEKVIIFDEATPDRLIRQITPHFIVKGSDYQRHEVVGKDFAEVIIFPRLPGYSTTRKIQRLGRE